MTVAIVDICVAWPLGLINDINRAEDGGNIFLRQCLPHNNLRAKRRVTTQTPHTSTLYLASLREIIKGEIRPSGIRRISKIYLLLITIYLLQGFGQRVLFLLRPVPAPHPTHGSHPRGPLPHMQEQGEGEGLHEFYPREDLRVPLVP